MTMQMLEQDRNQARVAIEFERRQIIVTGPNVVDVANIEDLANPTVVKAARNQMDIEGIVFKILAQSNQDPVPHGIILRGVEDLFNRVKDSKRAEMINNLSVHVPVRNPDILDDMAIDTVLDKVLHYFEDMELINTSYPTTEEDFLSSKLTVSGRVLAELAFGVERSMIIIA